MDERRDWRACPAAKRALSCIVTVARVPRPGDLRPPTNASTGPAAASMAATAMMLGTAPVESDDHEIGLCEASCGVRAANFSGGCATRSTNWAPGGHSRRSRVPPP